MRHSASVVQRKTKELQTPYRNSWGETHSPSLSTSCRTSCRVKGEAHIQPASRRSSPHKELCIFTGSAPVTKLTLQRPLSYFYLLAPVVLRSPRGDRNFNAPVYKELTVVENVKYTSPSDEGTLKKIPSSSLCMHLHKENVVTLMYSLTS